MKKIEKSVVIPERVVKDAIYIAEDGTVFEGFGSESKCEEYEKKYKVTQAIKDIPRKVIKALEDEYDVRDAFYITTEEEFFKVLDYLEIMKKFYASGYSKENDFKGPDWYIFWIEWQADTSNDYNIDTLTEKKEQINKYLKQFEN